MLQRGAIMELKSCRVALAAGLALVFLPGAASAGERNAALQNLKHIIVIMQENHSFDNYFGALAYVPGGAYHTPGREDRDEREGGCRQEDHRCVDGLSCRVDLAGNFICSNANRDDDGSIVFAFHDSRRCVRPDLDHGWANTHRE